MSRRAVETQMIEFGRMPAQLFQNAHIQKAPCTPPPKIESFFPDLAALFFRPTVEDGLSHAPMDAASLAFRLEDSGGGVVEKDLLSKNGPPLWLQAPSGGGKSALLQSLFNRALSLRDTLPLLFDFPLLTPSLLPSRLADVASALPIPPPAAAALVTASLTGRALLLLDDVDASDPPLTLAALAPLIAAGNTLVLASRHPPPSPEFEFLHVRAPEPTVDAVAAVVGSSDGTALARTVRILARPLTRAALRTCVGFSSASQTAFRASSSDDASITRRIYGGVILDTLRHELIRNPPLYKDDTAQETIYALTALARALIARTENPQGVGNGINLAIGSGLVLREGGGLKFGFGFARDYFISEAIKFEFDIKGVRCLTDSIVFSSAFRWGG